MTDAPTTIFTLDETLDEIKTLVRAFTRDRSVILDSLNAFQAVFVDFVASQQNYDATVTGQFAGLSVQIESLHTRLGERLHEVAAGLADLRANDVAIVISRLAALEATVSDLSDLVQALLQDMQGVATSLLQRQEIDLLNEVIFDVSPDQRPVKIAGDPSTISEIPQPLPFS